MDILIMEILINVYIFFIGAILASFFNVIALRVPAKVSIFRNSECPKCNNRINLVSLIPVVGYLVNKGKCSSCSSKISISYLIPEVLLGVTFVIFFNLYGLSYEFFIYSLLMTLLLATTISDLKYRIVLDSLLIFFGVIILIISIFIDIKFALIGGAVAFSMMYLIGFVGMLITKKQALGGGDIKLYAVIGIAIGFKLAIFSLFVASVFGMIFGKRMIKKEGYLPFVPFIFLGVLFSILYGEEILNWYFKFLGSGKLYG